MTIESELRQAQDAQGAIRNPESGVVTQFSTPEAEFEAARSNAVLFDLSGRTQLELTGAERHRFLHVFCTNEIRNLQPGNGCEAFVTSVQGKVLAHILVFAGENSLWVDSVPGYEDSLFKHLDKHLISEKVEFHRRSSDFTEFYATGPQATERLQQLGLPATGLALHQHRRGLLDEVPISVRRIDWFQQPGYLLQFPTAQGAGVWKSLTSKGILPAGELAFEGLRIVSLMPRCGIDMNEGTLAQEVARTDRAISFNKGCYLGQEPIARIDSLGHVNQELRGLRLESGPLPPSQSKVLMPGEVREAGVITSAAWDYSSGTPVALALLKRNYMSKGQKLCVVVGDQEITATVYERS